MTYISQRIQLVLHSKDITDCELPKSREDLELIFERYDLNILEKAFVLDIDVNLIFNEGFLKGFTFLELNREGDNNAIWKKVLNKS